MTAIIIDDEIDCVKLLSLQLKMYCPSITVLAECTQSTDGLEAIKIHKPDLVLLDIEMPIMNGFQLLENLGTIDFSLVFVTAYDKFAVKAFRFAAVDYLLKPIDAKELIEAVGKIQKIRNINEEQLLALKTDMSNQNNTNFDKIALSYQNGLTFVKLTDIIYGIADNNYTQMYLKDGRRLLSTKSLREIQELFEEQQFVRVHRQFIVNIDEIIKLVRGDNYHLIMSDNKSIPVSRSQKDKLINRLGWK